MRPRIALTLLVAIAAAAWYFIGLPLDLGLSEAEVADAERNGRRLYLAACAPCHAGEGGLPTLRDLQQDYSRRDLERVLASPPENMPSFSGTAQERRDLILFLTGG